MLKSQWHWCGEGKIVDRYRRICARRMALVNKNPDDHISKYVLSVLAIKNFPNLLWDQVPIHYEKNFTKAEQKLISDLRALRQNRI